MAQTSSRSFNNYSGLEQGGLIQTRQSATDLLSDPNAVRGLQETAPWALPISQRPAQSSGRSFYDPGRQAERWVRGTGSRDQTQAAFAAQGYREAADPIEAAKRRAYGPKGQGIVGAGTMRSLDPNFKDERQQRGGNIVGFGQLAGYDVNVPPSPPSPPMPNLFSGSMTNPAMAQSQYSIGAALNGNGFMVPPRPPSPPSPPRPPTSVSMAPQIYF